MVAFAVFNELSLPFQNTVDIKNKFGQFFVLLKELKKKNLLSIRVENDFRHFFILKGITFEAFIGQQNEDRDFQRRLKGFINKDIIIIDTPIIKEEDPEEIVNRFIENKYFYNTFVTSGGLACSDIWNTIAISFNSDYQWNVNKITLQKETLKSDGSDTVYDLDIRHAAKKEHLNIYDNFFEELEKEKKLGISRSDFWHKRDTLFPNRIIFCKEVEKQIKKVDDKIFYKAISMLRDIETDKKKLGDFVISGEGETVQKNPKLKSLRMFTVGSKKEYFNKHIKNLPNEGRVHYFEKEDKLYIGYIGEHLPTKNF